MDSLKDFIIVTTFILACSVSILFFALEYPTLNNQQSILLGSSYNLTAQDIATQLGEYESRTNLEINVSTADEPTIDAQSLQLVSTVSTSRTQMNRTMGTWSDLNTLLKNSFGVSGGNLLLIIGSITALFGVVLLYYVVKLIRYGI